MTDATVNKKTRIPREKWMGVTKMVRAQGYKSEILRKYGSITSFARLAGISYAHFNEFLNGRCYWRKSFEEVCESYLYGENKQKLPDLAYKSEIDMLRSEVKMLFGTAKDMCEEFKVSKPQAVYGMLNKWGKSRRKGVSYWQIRWAIAEKKLQILKLEYEKQKVRQPIHPDA